MNSETETSWKDLHDAIEKDGLKQFEISERTQSSQNLVKDLTKLNLDARINQKITNGTILHDQKASNLCHNFAFLSALRHEMARMFQGKISKDVNIDTKGPKKVICFRKGFVYEVEEKLKTFWSHPK